MNGSQDRREGGAYLSQRKTTVDVGSTAPHEAFHILQELGGVVYIGLGFPSPQWHGKAGQK